MHSSLLRKINMACSSAGSPLTATTEAWASGRARLRPTGIFGERGLHSPLRRGEPGNLGPAWEAPTLETSPF